jgi:hypothetical protein
LAIPELTEMGRPGLDPGTRELIEYPYIIVCEVHEDRGDIVVLSMSMARKLASPRKSNRGMPRGVLACRCLGILLAAWR